jgi:hypothetical protein
MNDLRQHVLVWVAFEFLQSEGMIHVLRELKFLPDADRDLDALLESAEQIGGFGLMGQLVESHHGAGIWVAPAGEPGLQLMIPWQYVRSVVTAQESGNSKTFGLLRDLMRKNGQPKPGSNGTHLPVPHAPGTHAPADSGQGPKDGETDGGSAKGGAVPLP